MTDENDFSVDLPEENEPQIENKPEDTPAIHKNEDQGHQALMDRIATITARRPIVWQIVRILGFFFLGWNGLQLVFLPNLSFIVLNSETLSTLFSSLISDNSGFLPLIIFIIGTYLLIMFIMHLLTEMEYRSRLNHYIIPWSDVPVLFVNYGIPLFMQFLFILLLQAIVLIILFLGYLLLSSFTPIHIDMYYLASRIATVFITFPWIVMQFMLDTTLERGVKGRTFSYCFRRAKYLLANKTTDIFRYLIVRLTLILLSLIAFKVFIYTIILPFKIYLFYNWNVNTNLIFGNLNTLSDVIVSAVKILFGLIIMGILFSPISTPLYWLNTRLIRKYLYRSGQI
jgi:hypothetical protein